MVALSLFALGLFAKQFYILPSGSFQIGDFFFISSFFVYLFRKKKIVLYKDEQYLFVFLGAIIVINSIYMLKDHWDFSYMRYTVYYVYNYMIIILFSQFVRSNMDLKSVLTVLKLNLILQLLFFLLGIGRMYGISRYKGTFNDPNQFGFFCLMCFFMLDIFHVKLKYSIKNRLFWYGLTGILVVLSSSTGMVLGMAVYGVVLLCITIYKGKRLQAVISIFIGLSLCIGIFGLLTGAVPIPDFIENSHLFSRVLQKLRKLGAGGNDYSSSFWIDRGIDKIFYFPAKILYGAGEGNWRQYAAYTPHADEIHSTVIGLLFYYGIIPWLILMNWCRKKVRKGGIGLLPVYAALFAESLTLANQRQPMYWMIWLLADYSPRLWKKNNIEE